MKIVIMKKTSGIWMFINVCAGLFQFCCVFRYYLFFGVCVYFLIFIFALMLCTPYVKSITQNAHAIQMTVTKIPKICAIYSHIHIVKFFECVKYTNWVVYLPFTTHSQLVRYLRTPSSRLPPNWLDSMEMAFVCIFSWFYFFFSLFTEIKLQIVLHDKYMASISIYLWSTMNSHRYT